MKVKTRENYFCKVVNYMKSVYNIESGLNKLEDCRNKEAHTNTNRTGKTFY